MSKCPRCYYGTEYCICKHAVTDSSPAVVIQPAPQPTQRQSPHLFELEDLRSLRCTLCNHLIPPGPDQRRARAIHGKQHAREGLVSEKHLLGGELYFILNELAS
jgi:hypothetical protein